MTKTDLLFLVHNRRAFTEAALGALRVNTDWRLVNRLWLYCEAGDDDGARDRTVCWARELGFRNVGVQLGSYGSPAAIMNDYLSRGSRRHDLFCKIDNDVIVPPGWLNQCLDVMNRHPELHLLGIEPPASRTPAPWSRGQRLPAPDDCNGQGQPVNPGYARCEFIGGIGIMRTAAFDGRTRMQPHSTYGGFTDWQVHQPDLVKGWIVPPLRLFLLDRLPVEPWASLSAEYISKGWQRPWTNYAQDDTTLWDWWTDAR